MKYVQIDRRKIKVSVKGIYSMVYVLLWYSKMCFSEVNFTFLMKDGHQRQIESLGYSLLTWDKYTKNIARRVKLLTSDLG